MLNSDAAADYLQVHCSALCATYKRPVMRQTGRTPQQTLFGPATARFASQSKLGLV
ncbi:uncharacterized protein METZ01_LOCUS255484 [marine metagenome]|uniref:Uncharacterized protein n=1 Tax=marine metagenome TaxID=408172 RepID=A0A382ISH3_9ZZZZ